MGNSDAFFVHPSLIFLGNSSVCYTTHYYTRWRKYASEQKLTSSPLTVRVYALSSFADTMRLTPFECNTKLDFSAYRGQLAIEVLHVLKALAPHGFISSPLTPTPLCRSTPILLSRLDPVDPSKL